MKYTADLFINDCKTLAEQVSSYDFTHILCVERGGGHVVNELTKHISNKIYYVVPIYVSFYEGETRRETPYIEYWSGKVFSKKEKVLIVDDLVDGGHTLTYIKNMHILKNVGDMKTATLCVKKSSPFKPDYYIRDNILDWIIFPWGD